MMLYADEKVPEPPPADTVVPTRRPWELPAIVGMTLDRWGSAMPTYMSWTVRQYRVPWVAIFCDEDARFSVEIANATFQAVENPSCPKAALRCPCPAVDATTATVLEALRAVDAMQCDDPR